MGVERRMVLTFPVRLISMLAGVLFVTAGSLAGEPSGTQQIGAVGLEAG